MTHPGGFAGDPAGQQPGGQPYRGPGAVTLLSTMTGTVMGLSTL